MPTGKPSLITHLIERGRLEKPRALAGRHPREVRGELARRLSIQIESIRQVADRYSMQSAQKTLGVVANLSRAIEIRKADSQRLLERQKPVHPEFLAP